MTILAQHNDGVKTVQSEAIRLTTMILRLQHMKKTIGAARAEHLQRRISAQFLVYDEVAAFAAFDQIEAEITCPHCGGSGMRRVINGFDAGDIFVATDDEYVPCTCQHDGEQDIEIGG